MKSKKTTGWQIYKLRDAHNRGLIENIPVQRALVWQKQRKVELIDSIVCGIDIPKFYFKQEEGRYYIIDGQQRVNAITSFLNDEFPFQKQNPQIASQIAIETGQRWSDLSLETQDDFLRQEIDVVELCGYSDLDIYELFRRLQLGMVLTEAEQRRGLPGGCPVVVRELSMHGTFRKLLKGSNKRGGYEDVAAKILFMTAHGNARVANKDSLKDMFEYNKELSMNSRTVKDILATLRFIEKYVSGVRFNATMFLDLVVVTGNLLQEYNLRPYGEAYGRAIAEFMKQKAAADGADEDWIHYIASTKAATNNPDKVQFRQKFMKDFIEDQLIDLRKKDDRRIFTEQQREQLFLLADGKCEKCGEELTLDEMEAHHKVPYSEGGETTVKNGQCLCRDCHAAVHAKKYEYPFRDDQEGCDDGRE